MTSAHDNNYSSNLFIPSVVVRNRGVFVVVAGGLLLMTTVASAVITALLQLPVFQPSTL